MFPTLITLLCFHCEIRKNFFELSSIPPLIWSSDESDQGLQCMLMHFCNNIYRSLTIKEHTIKCIKCHIR